MTDTPKPTNAIAIVDPAISDWHDEWLTNRAFITGARAVRAGGETFLPRFPTVDVKQHAAIIERTTVFAGASLTAKGMKGLLFRKAPTITCPDAYADVLATITIEADSILDLCEDVADETLAVNFGVMITDYPPATGPISLKEAIDKGIRPRILLYPAECILGIETGAVNGRKRVTRVRLQDDSKTIRELVLIDGVYTVNIWRQDVTNDWAIAETFVPTRQLAGRKVETLDEIPATVMTTGRKFKPHTAPLYDVCDLNKSHYHASSNLTTCDYWLGNPQPWTTGTKPNAAMAITPGGMWQFEEEGARVGMLEYTGAQAGQLESRVNTLKDYMAAAGSRILASEKAGAESGYALEIRNAAETASLDGVARAVERFINDQLAWVAWWLGLEEVDGKPAISVAFSTDFVSSKLNPEERKQIVAEWQAGVYSLDTALDLLTAGNVLTDDFDRDADKERMAQDVADRPPVDAITPIQDAPSAGDDSPA